VRFAIVRSLFNADVTARLLEGARRGFADAGVPARQVRVVEVPGSFELPLAALWLARTRRYDGIVCLGCVIRGETSHFEHVASQAARGIAWVSLSTGVPVIFGVLTTETLAQALARAQDVAAAGPQHARDGPRAGAEGNKGYEAAMSAVHMAHLRRQVGTRR
jgi:6,7-dimethyl-8-ribityllumazine synthase